MAVTNNLINIGNVVNDGLGDDLRTAFRKVNENFTELNNLGTLVVNNLGEGATVFKSPLTRNSEGSNVLEFRTLISGTNVEVLELPNSIKISSFSPPSFGQIETETGVINATGSIREVVIQGGVAPGGITPDIHVSNVANRITISNVFPVTDVLTGFDFGNLSGPRNIIDVLMSAANIDFGTITNPGTLNIDFGFIVPTA